jgi:outer membrane protein assembly factor BamA
MRALAPCLALAFLPAGAAADPTHGASTRIGDPTEQAGKAKDAKSTASFVAMPIPLSDPAIGTGLGVAAMALYNQDKSGRPWTTGAGGLYTDLESWAAAVFHKSHFAEDRYRLTAAAAYGDFNLDFYGVGVDAGSRGLSVKMEQEGALFLGEFLVRAQPHFYIGARYIAASVNTTIQLPQLAAFPDLDLPDIELESMISSLGLSSEYDTRDSEYGPRKGIYASGQWLFSDEAIGSDFDYDRVNLAVNGYVVLDGKTTLAWRGSVCWAGDGAPFYDICNFGSQNDLRGYPAGQYRDHAMYAVQAELRRPLFWKIGGVAFAGFGEVASGFDELTSDEILPAAGFGLRFTASEEYRVNASIDFAVGDATSAIYFYIGEAF